jgi:hypothetical protein
MRVRNNVMIIVLSQLVKVLPKVFLLHNGTREGRSADYFAILWVTSLVGTTRASLSGFRHFSTHSNRPLASVNVLLQGTY